MLRSRSLKQRPKPSRHSERSEEPQIHFEPVTQPELEQRCFATLKMTMRTEMNR